MKVGLVILAKMVFFNDLVDDVRRKLEWSRNGIMGVDLPDRFADFLNLCVIFGICTAFMRLHLRI